MITLLIYNLLPGEPFGSIDLSRALKLREVAFVCRMCPKWITMTLRTIKFSHRDHKLQQISLRTSGVLYVLHHQRPDPTTFRNAIGESSYRKWQELDGLLTHLQESHSTRLRVLYNVPSWLAGQCARICMEKLLPETTTRGVAELVESRLPWW